MRLATFNMRQGGGLAHWVAVLDATNPDLLFVQESTDPRAFAPDLFDPIDLRGALWAPVGHGRWGSALFPRRARVRPVRVPGFEGWVVGGETDIAGEILFAFSVHLPPKDGSYVKAAHQVLDAIEPIVASAPVVLAGDWNLTVTANAAAAQLGSHAPGQELLARLQSGFGLRSAWDLVNSEGSVPQTLRWARNPETPYHCDGLFLPEQLANSLQGVDVLEGSPWTELSDHNPVVARFATRATDLEQESG